MLAKRLKLQRELVFHGFGDGPRHADAARLGYLLQPCSDVDPVAMAILTFNDHVA